MQFDLDVIRAILIQVEHGPAETGWVDLSIAGHDDESVARCVQQLYEAGYIDALELWTLTGEVWKPIRLTWRAQAILDALRDDRIWEKAKGMVAASSAGQDLTATLDALKNALATITKDPNDEN